MISYWNVEPVSIKPVNQAESGIQTAGGEQKQALFADDLLLTISHPTQVLPKIIKLLSDYGSVSGYKFIVNKTQVLPLNYDPSE